jgi:hypothetical protein
MMTMSINQWLVLVGIIVSAGTALSVGYSNRKQARHLEAYRRDPSVGLDPPDSVVWALVKQWWLEAICLCWSLTGVIYEMNQTGPVTRASVLVISMGICGVAFSWVGIMLTIVLRRSTRAIADMTEKLRSAATP